MPALGLLNVYSAFVTTFPLNGLPDYAGDYWNYAVILNNTEARLHAGLSEYPTFPLTHSPEPTGDGDYIYLLRPSDLSFVIPVAAGARTITIDVKHFANSTHPVKAALRASEVSNTLNLYASSNPSIITPQQIVINLAPTANDMLTLTIKRSDPDDKKIVGLGNITIN
jgi:hypothetical protein